MSFKNFNLAPSLLSALEEAGYNHPTPIQAQAIPELLNGKDVLGIAQTGTGKTAAFSLPILQGLINAEEKNNFVKVLVLAPTRELAIQIYENVNIYAKKTNIRAGLVYGGVSQHTQVMNLRRGIDFLIATPGRLMDLMNQGHISLVHIKHLVLDEADRMLDMGFIADIRRIMAKLPAKRQTLLFSATMPAEIKSLSDQLLKNPVQVNITPVSTSGENIDQSIYFVEKPMKKDLLTHIIAEKGIQHALVFTRTKHGADKVARDLNKKGIRSEAIHGDKTQGARQRALKGFKSREIKVLVATDIASRGIDIEKLSHVFNFELPEQAETYVHRIGRTGRAGESGTAISFCTREERAYMNNINKLIRKKIPVIESHPFL